jgi:oligopeptidase A
LSNPLLESSGLPRFSAILPEHVEPAVDAVLTENRASLEAILQAADGNHADFDRTVVPLEALADRLHRVWSPVSHLHAVANTPELREVYNRCLPALARYETELAQDERIFRVYDGAARRLPADRDDGAPRLLQLALRDFRLAGVDLPPEQKQRFKAIVEELSQLQARFEQNVLDGMAAWSHHDTVADHVAGIPESVLEQAEARARGAGQDGWLFTLDQPTYIAIMTHAHNRDLRHRFYRAWVTRASDQASAGKEFDNGKVIEEILALRHEAAVLAGFDNYAEFSLATKMAGSVAEVQGFLNQLASRSRPAAKRELEELERFAGQGLAAWDIAYHSERLRQDRYAVSDEELRPYFPLARVMDGLFQLVERLYQVRVEPVDGVDVWHPDVRYYRLTSADGQELGGFFTDLYARAGKRSGAWMDDCVNRSRRDGELQRPVAHLVCNFGGPTASRPSLLTHDEVLTLFHEFGHGLHHMLTRVEHPGVAGINGVPWDAVELPSQFMENFAWQPEVVAMISGHYLSGDALPEELLERLRASRVFQAGMQMVRQLEFAIFDFRLHAEYDPRRGSRLIRVLESVRKQVSVVRHPEFNRFAHAFSHIFGGGYAAGYYSYKWAEVLAADAWSAFEQQGVLDPETATRFRREILEVGGTVDIAEAFRAFRGRPPEIAPLLAQTGILEHEGGSLEMAQ